MITMPNEYYSNGLVSRDYSTSKDWLININLSHLITNPNATELSIVIHLLQRIIKTNGGISKGMFKDYSWISNRDYPTSKNTRDKWR